MDIAGNEKYKKKFLNKWAEYKDAVLAQTIDTKKKALIIQAAQEDGTVNDMKNVPKGDKLKSFLAGVMKGNAALMAKSLRFLDPKQTVAAVKELGDRLTASQKEAAGVSFKKADIEEYGDLEGLEGKGGLEGKLLAKMKTAKLEYMDEDAAMRYAGKDENGNIIAGLGHKFWTGAHISKGAELFGRKFVEAFSHGIPEAMAAGYYNDNPRLDNWLGSSAARNLGINGPEKPTEQTKKIKETMKETTEQIKETTEQIGKLTEQIGGLSSELQKVDDEITAMSAGGWGVTQADYDIAVAPLKAKKATLETQRTTLENTRTTFVTQKTTFEAQKTDFEKQIKDVEEKAKKEREANKKSQQSTSGSSSSNEHTGDTGRNKDTK